jgi:hypothetical protein
MERPAKSGAKQARGRFRPGESGNPKGRPQGSRNKVSLLVEGMIEGEAEALTRQAINFAMSGDSSLLKALLDRLAPPRKERPVTINLPALTSPADGPRIAAELLERAASGELTPTEAQGLATLLEAFRRQTELANFEERLAVLEAAHGNK